MMWSLVSAAHPLLVKSVSSLLLYPSELNNEDSTTSLRMIHALHLLADAIESPLDMSPLRESEGTASWLGQLVSEEADE